MVEAAEDFSFHEPAGICLGRAPFIAAELFVGCGEELNTIAETLQPVSESPEQQRGGGFPWRFGDSVFAVYYANCISV